MLRGAIEKCCAILCFASIIIKILKAHKFSSFSFIVSFAVWLSNHLISQSVNIHLIHYSFIGFFSIYKSSFGWIIFWFVFWTAGRRKRAEVPTPLHTHRHTSILNIQDNFIKFFSWLIHSTRFSLSLKLLRTCDSNCAVHSPRCDGICGVLGMNGGGNVTIRLVFGNLLCQITTQ